jgi:hypothetical protein
MTPKPINAAKSILAKKKNTNKAFDSADEVVNPDENKDARPWWDIFNFSCCGTDRNDNTELDKKIDK